ncbi:UNVERIFIED_CONTAM: hypothetical protein FKN15_075887 [Acipenser sinensis]
MGINTSITRVGNSGNISYSRASSTFAAPPTPIAEATATNAFKDNLRAYYSTKEIQLSEIVSDKNAFKPDSPVPFLVLPADDVINFTTGEGFFTTVLVEDASTPGISAGTIAENFRVPPDSFPNGSGSRLAFHCCSAGPGSSDVCVAGGVPPDQDAPKTMTAVDARTAGYLVNSTSSRVIFRSPYGMPMSEVLLWQQSCVSYFSVSGVPLTLPEAQNRGVKISEVLHPNGTKDFVLKVPFDNPLVSVEYIGALIRRYTLNINYTLNIVPQNEPYFHPAAIVCDVKDVNLPDVKSFCTNRSVVFEVTPGNMDSSWELCIGSRPLPYTIAEPKITIELPLFSIGYIYEDISLRGLTVRVELNMRNVKTLQVEKQFVQRCPIPTRELLVCFPNGVVMVVAVTMEPIPVVDPSKTTLLDKTCKPKEFDSTRALFTFGVNTCGTRSQIVGNYLIYENEVLYTRALFPPNAPVITRDSEYSVDRYSQIRGYVSAGPVQLVPEGQVLDLKTAELPQTTLTLEPPFPEIFTGETVTLRCGVEGGSAGWKYLWYKDSEDTPVLQTAGHSITGDSYTITAAAVSDQGQYCCRGQREDPPRSSQLSNPVTVTVSEGHPKAVLTLQPAWTEIFSGETVTLSCEVEGGSAGWRFKQYRDGREEAGCSDEYSSRYGDSCTISYAQNSHNGVYWCESASGQERSNAITLTVSNKRVSLQIPPQPVFEGDTLTLRCLIRDGYKATSVIYYKDNKELQSQADTELSVDRVSKSDEGSYKCRAWWSSSTYSGDSAEVLVSVRDTFTLESIPAVLMFSTQLRKTSDQEQEQSAERIELSSHVQHTGVELE